MKNLLDLAVEVSRIDDTYTHAQLEHIIDQARVMVARANTPKGYLTALWMNDRLSNKVPCNLPDCDGVYRLRESLGTGNRFYGCSRYPDCHDTQGQPWVEERVGVR